MSSGPTLPNINDPQSAPMSESLGMPAGMMPPPEPPITPPTQGFGAWASDPRNMAKVAPYLVPQPTAPNVDPTAAQSMFSDNSPAPAMGQPVDLGAPSVAPPTLAQDQQTDPNAYGKPYLKNGQASKMQTIAAALMGFGGGVRGNPMAGADYIHGLQAHDLNLSGQNNQIYNQRFIQPQIDALAPQIAQNKLADVQSQIQNRTATQQAIQAKNETALAKQGLKHDENGNIVPMSDEELSPELKMKQQTLKNVQLLNESKIELNSAKADLAKSGNDPTSAAYQLAKRRVDAAVMRTGAILGQLGLHQQEFELSSKGTIGGVQPVGGLSTPEGQPVGTKFEGNLKAPTDAAKRSQLAGVAGGYLNDIEGILQRRPDLIGPVSGRYTNAKQMIGNKDPDINALGVALDDYGSSRMGMHGSRSPQLKKDAESSLLNSFHSGPEGAAAAIAQARKDSQQMQGSAMSGKFAPGVSVKGVDKPSKANDPLGIR